jgi:hypothetical protein
MKYFIFMCSALLAACSGPLIPASYSLVPPELPAAWREVLGEPRWRFSWVAPDGCIAAGEADGGIEAAVMQDWASAVIAWPYWPGLEAGVMKPAGAIFPLDAADGVITLSYQGGVEAFFYFALAGAGNENRLPAGFDWKRFRELFTTGNLPEEVIADPWLADWKQIGRKTAESGFDKRRIKTQDRGSIKIEPRGNGPWISPSPFAAPASWQEGKSVLLTQREEVDTWVSKNYILHCGNGIATWKE